MTLVTAWITATHRMLRQGSVVTLALLAVGSNTSAQGPVSYPPISVADVVRQTVIGDPMSLTWNDFAAQTSSASPDGVYSAIVLRRGNPQSNTNDAQLLVYRTAELLDAARPQVIAQFASATNYQPIALVRWLADSRTLVFAATQGSDMPQVYRADLRTGRIEPLTQLQSPLKWYDISASAQHLATISEPVATRSREEDPQCLQHGCLVTAETLRAAQLGISETSSPVVLYDLRSGSSRTFAQPEATDAKLMTCFDELTGGLSPDGRFGLRICRVRAHRWPSWWSDYTTYPGIKAALSSGATGYLRQWMLYDFERQTVTRLTPAPYFNGHYGYKSRPLWIDNGRGVIIAGALEPLQDVSADERARRASHYAILLIDSMTHETQRIDQLDSRVLFVTATSWDSSTETLTVESMDAANQDLPTLIYRRDAGHWMQMRAPHSHATSAGLKVEGEPQLFVRQSSNAPPVLAARDPRTGATRNLLDPNPWLAERKLGHIETISWKSKDGREWKGGLTYPPGYTPGKRYPLVLQTHGFAEDTFSLSGSARVFAAQPLAGLGMVVLQIAENTRGMNEVDEWPVVQAGYESAIDHLDALELIDRDHVGIQGWSRSGAYAGYTLTHSPYKFTAGAFTSTADFGWWWYLLQGAKYGETEYGMQPFSGEGLDVWQKMSPSFNLFRVNTPMLMCSEGVTGLWDWYVGLRRLEKPVDYWSFPGITHDVFKVPERMAINQLVVDWFRFWLKDEEDADPSKSRQYQRWRKLREQQALALENSEQN